MAAACVRSAVALERFVHIVAPGAPVRHLVGCAQVRLFGQVDDEIGRALDRQQVCQLRFDLARDLHCAPRSLSQAHRGQ